MFLLFPLPDVAGGAGSVWNATDPSRIAVEGGRVSHKIRQTAM